MKVNTSTRISYAITKLVLAVALTLTFLYSVFVLGYSWVIEDNIFNRLVAQQVTAIKRNYDMTGIADVSKGQIYQLHQGWDAVPTSIRQMYSEEPHRVEYTLENGKTYHLAHFYLGNDEFVLLADVEGFEVSRDYLSGILISLLGVSLFSCACVMLLGWRMGRRIAKPIEALAGEVKTLHSDQQNSVTELITTTQINEVSALAKAINDSFTQLNNALTREIHFTKDISHEIRTPISVLQNALSQSIQGEVNAEHGANTVCFSAQSVQQMKNATEQLAQTTHILLALARNESSIRESLSLNQVIEKCVLSHFGLNHTQKGESLELDISLPHEDIVINANRNLLEILVNNLLSNIVAHATGNRVDLQLVERCLTLTNQYEQDLPDNLLFSGSKGQDSTGIGQGLSLVKRICDACGWGVNVQVNTEMQYFTVIIDFH
ncbi:sensor histidine kinase [Alteromonas sediminis]|uniref:histidine kinase n=1 Tax=Alteromonas sediminis TaxID=2259342 RepID=A0A3N5Y2T6_9ALTE|nr:sensor histidine kinase [Alteromonas sediminis]